MDSLPFETARPTAYEWTEKAYDLLLDGKLVVGSVMANGVRIIAAQGQCPRCDDDVAFVMETHAPLPATSRSLGASAEVADEYEAIEVTCRCAGSHPGRPEQAAQRGCGIAFRVDVLREAAAL
ncbi:MAG: hypothetical protein LBJ02_11985 [Bifidobacteriaceae bacterium]|jgi:hypothetical protein|nr:hypothetical protein [Bifidobacteriaceae bacterium]